jgi:hypothetical protein
MEFWDLFWHFLIYIPLTILWIYTVVDIFRRPDESGLAKFLWLLLILFLLLLGMLIYFIARPPDETLVEDMVVEHLELPRPGRRTGSGQPLAGDRP